MRSYTQMRPGALNRIGNPWYEGMLLSYTHGFGNGPNVGRLQTAAIAIVPADTEWEFQPITCTREYARLESLYYARGEVCIPLEEASEIIRTMQENREFTRALEAA